MVITKLTKIKIEIRRIRRKEGVRAGKVSNQSDLVARVVDAVSI